MPDRKMTSGQQLYKHCLWWRDVGVLSKIPLILLTAQFPDLEDLTLVRSLLPASPSVPATSQNLLLQKKPSPATTLNVTTVRVQNQLPRWSMIPPENSHIFAMQNSEWAGCCISICPLCPVSFSSSSLLGSDRHREKVSKSTAKAKPNREMRSISSACKHPLFLQVLFSGPYSFGFYKRKAILPSPLDKKEMGSHHKC